MKYRQFGHLPPVDNHVALSSAVMQRITGTAGNDRLEGASGSDVINGKAGADKLFGHDGDDRLSGGKGDDLLKGGDGDDRLDGGAGMNTLIGGLGLDTVDYSTRQSISLTYGTGGLQATVAGRSVDTLSDMDVIIGGYGDDVMSGPYFPYDLVLRGGDGDDIISYCGYAEGGGGDDLIYAVRNDIDGKQTLDGGEDYDTLSFIVRNESVYLDLRAGSYSFESRPSPDSVQVVKLFGFEEFVGGNETDFFYGDDEANTFRGGDGPDFFHSGGCATGTDVLDGGEGDDGLFLEGDPAIAVGGDGDDVFYVFDQGRVGDVLELHGGDGRDQFVAYNAPSALTVNLFTGMFEFASGRSGSIDGFENVSGTNGNDYLIGNRLRNDLDGGDGADILTGGDGADHFVFSKGGIGGAIVDRITDFNHAQHDVIDLSDLTADVGNRSGGKFDFVGTSAFSGVVGELRYEIVDGNTLVSGDNDGDAVGDFTIQLDGPHDLVAADFKL